MRESEIRLVLGILLMHSSYECVEGTTLEIGCSAKTNEFKYAMVINDDVLIFNISVKY